MIGHHATAGKNVASILEHGLVPYKIHKDWVPPEWRGIWLWEDRPQGIDWVHIALQRWLDHQDPRVALLAVEFDEHVLKAPDGKRYDVTHDGSVQGNHPHARWIYHSGVKAWISWRPIPATQITLLGITDFSRPAGIEDFDAPTLYPVEIPQLERVS